MSKIHTLQNLINGLKREIEDVDPFAVYMRKEGFDPIDSYIIFPRVCKDLFEELKIHIPDYVKFSDALEKDLIMMKNPINQSF